MVSEWAVVFREPLGLCLGGDTEPMSPRAPSLEPLVSISGNGQPFNSRWRRCRDDDEDVMMW